MNVEEIIKTDKDLPLEKRTILHLGLVTNKVQEIITTTLKPYDVSTQQFNVLRILRGQKGKPANLSTLNERMVTKMSNTTRLVDKLMQKGYVNRITCPSNRRKIEINITNEGEAILLKMDKDIKLSEEKILKKFDNKDLKELNNLLDKF
ncbi:MarR family transcriptional regulator [Cellulophaga sp. HaHaR_3_176]|uniref:MarR family winged helix-turn-helix transcriptional regulator n=1 Tax=Cellulophaga sp. HaHaR_3_176 TaxID=1942464 RepID=UPI001C1F54A4|nr:MarR family transcriptional regulator [Cellulophaga sp. HaHaR_3_176]QWX84412.1 MarR family transcriptional regulator [Cellulophaga sp. HaHaR_3_176]